MPGSGITDEVDMSVDEMLAQHFPVSPETFRDLRRRDAEFALICSDFLELTNRMAVGIVRANNTRLRHLADIADTISSLADEIDTKLQQSEKALRTEQDKDDGAVEG